MAAGNEAWKTSTPGNGQVGRKDFCAQTRDAVVRWPRRPHGDAGGDGVSSELVPGQGGMPDAIRFTVPVAALERAVGEALPRDGSRTVFVWAHSRPRAARATPYAYAPDRRVVDRLPVPDLSDGCARPQTAGEALAVTLTDPSTQTFDYTGDLQIYTVPQGVSVLLLTVTGATGCNVSPAARNSRASSTTTCSAGSGSRWRPSAARCEP